MNLRIFILGLMASFGLAWLVVVLVPYYSMRSLAPVTLNEATDGAKGIFFPKRSGRTLAGAEVYAENGCYQCHTQLVRPTYAGNDLFRADWGGLKTDPDRGDTRRETNAYDYLGENFAQIGVARVGPDLSNFGRRIAARDAAHAEEWTFQHLFRPRSLAECWSSTCPPHPFLFEEIDAKGVLPQDAIPYDAIADQDYAAKLRENRKALVPGPDARALVSYLLGLKKDQSVPKALDFAPPKEEKKP